MLVQTIETLMSNDGQGLMEYSGIKDGSLAT
jgi:hypothetical protein